MQKLRAEVAKSYFLACLCHDLSCFRRLAWLPPLKRYSTFLQEPVEIVGFDAVVFAYVPLRLVTEGHDPVDVVLIVGEEL